MNLKILFRPYIYASIIAALDLYIKYIIRTNNIQENVIIDNFLTIDLTYNTENPNNWVFTELWDSKEHYEKYLQFRTEDGTLEAVASLCEAAPSIRIFDIVPT